MIALGDLLSVDTRRSSSSSSAGVINLPHLTTAAADRRRNGIPA